MKLRKDERERSEGGFRIELARNTRMVVAERDRRQSRWRELGARQRELKGE